MRATIYGLCDPVTHELRYVGKTIAKPKDRLSGHIASAKREKNHRAAWINAVVATGSKPEMVIFDQVVGDGCAAEITMIGIAKALGCRLVNATRGGEGTLGRIVSAETRAKVSRALKGISKPWGGGYVMTEDHRSGVRAYMSGRVVSAETRRKVGAFHKGKPWSAARRAAHLAKKSI